MRRKRDMGGIGIILFIVFLPIAVLWELAKAPGCCGMKRGRRRRWF